MEILINSQPSPTPSQLSVLDLNDYCLLEAFSYLSLDDLIFISTTCTRFEYNAQRLFPHRLKLWKDVSLDFKTSQLLLSKIGPFLTEIEICNDYRSAISIEETMGLIAKNCKNLEKIYLNHSIPSSLLTLPPSVKNITINFPENWNLSDGFLDGLRTFTSLESLSLKFYHFTQIDSSFLTELPPLKLLRLKNFSIEPMNLKECLQKSKPKLEIISLGNCLPEFPHVLVENIDHLVKLNELELQFSGGLLDQSPSNIFNRLTSLKLSNGASTIDVDTLFSALIEHNKIQTLSLNSFDNSKSLKRTTLQQLHRLTNLRRLFLYESDFVTDDFLMEISKSQNLTHFNYKQTYQPLLSFDAVLALVVSNGPKLEKCYYTVYHDTSDMDQSKQKTQLMVAFRGSAAFKRILQCKEDISNKMTSVEFLFKKFKKV